MRPKHKEWATKVIVAVRATYHNTSFIKHITFKVMMVSSLNGEGLKEVWEQLQAFRQVMLQSGEFEKRRAEQRKKWMWSYIQHRLLEVCKKMYAETLNSSLDRCCPVTDLSEAPVC